MKKLLAALLTACACNAQVFFAELTSPYPEYIGHVDIFDTGPTWTFDLTWNEICAGGGPQDTVVITSQHGDVAAFVSESPETFWLYKSNWATEGIEGQTFHLTRSGDLGPSAKGTITAYPTPEPLGGGVLGIGLLAFTLRRKRLIATAMALTLCFGITSYAADDDQPTELVPTTITTTTQIEPVAWELTIVGTPVTKVNGVNVGTVTQVRVVKVTRLLTREFANGAQTKETTVKEVRAELDVTDYVKANAITVEGFLRLDFNTNKWTRPSVFWNKTVEKGVAGVNRDVDSLAGK